MKIRSLERIKPSDTSWKVAILKTWSVCFKKSWSAAVKTVKKEMSNAYLGLLQTAMTKLFPKIVNG